MSDLSLANGSADVMFFCGVLLGGLNLYAYAWANKKFWASILYKHLFSNELRRFEGLGFMHGMHDLCGGVFLKKWCRGTGRAMFGILNKRSYRGWG